MSEDCESIYETTIEDCQEWFKVLNRELFENNLPQINEIDIRWRRGAYAYYDYDERRSNGTCKLLMSKRYKSKKFFIEILAHEMVHHYQYINNEGIGHGSSFLKWRDKFNKKGLNLARSY
jgi:predicted SprT family Zn-dependent metalloprotease